MTEITIVGYNDWGSLSTFTFEYDEKDASFYEQIDFYGEDFEDTLIQTICNLLNINGGEIRLPNNLDVRVVSEYDERYTVRQENVTIKRDGNCGWYTKVNGFCDTPFGEGDKAYELLKFADVIKQLQGRFLLKVSAPLAQVL